MTATPTHPGDREALADLLRRQYIERCKWDDHGPVQYLRDADAILAAGFRLTPPITSDDERRAVELANEVLARIEGGSPIFAIGEARALARFVLSLHAELERVRK